MTERREAVARAIYGRVIGCDDCNYAWEREPNSIRDGYRASADAAIAAMQAEPTEAEIGAACPECGGHGRGCSFCGGTGDWPRTTEPTEAEAWQALVAFQNAACDAGYQAGVQGLSHWAELPDAVIGPLEHHLRTTHQTIHDAAIAAYESSVVFECDECGGRGKIVGQYDQDNALAAMEAEPTEAEIEAARHEYITKHDAYIEAAKANAECQCYARDDYPECVERIYENAGHEAMRAALLAARKAQR